MVIKSIREFNHAVPFVPYEIRTASGERFEVGHPDFISISPRASYVIVIDDQESGNTARSPSSVTEGALFDNSPPFFCR